MAPKLHPTPLSGGDRKALAKELGRARAMTNILATQAAEARAKGEALIRTADRLLCESCNERMWADGEPNPETGKKDVVWFALDESRPLFCFAGIWTTFTGDRGTKSTAS